MIAYLACLAIGLLGAAVALGQDRKERWIIFGASLYFVAIFGAAIYSMHGGAQ